MSQSKMIKCINLYIKKKMVTKRAYITLSDREIERGVKASRKDSEKRAQAPFIAWVENKV